MRSIPVRLNERSYPVLVGRDILPRLGAVLKKAGIRQQIALVVTQKEVIAHCRSALVESLTREGYEPVIYLVSGGKRSEAAKSRAVYDRLIRRLASLDGKGKSIFLAALGGGVVGDLTGFAAAVYRRGIPYVQIPTTLTAQTDSAIGGKTGIDLPEGKNLLGVIYQPRMVFCDVKLLDTLPGRHWSDGFAEMIKTGVVRDPHLFSLLEKFGREGVRASGRLLEKAILRSARVKAKIVSRDEFDKKDVRIVLNFGHTAGHAIEAASRFSRFTHGEAVAVGMLIACDIAEALGVLKDTTLTARLEKTLLKFELPLFTEGLAAQTVAQAMGYDKKNREGTNRFVLPVALGKTAIVNDVPSDVILAALRRRGSKE